MIILSRWKVTLVVLSVILGLLFSAPNVMSASDRARLPAFLPKQALNLGLDLRGGSYLLFEVDTQALRAERLTNLVEDTRTTLTQEKIAASQPAVVGGAVVVRITDPNQVAAAARALRNTLGAPLAGALGGRDVTVATETDQRIRIAFAPEAMEAEGARAVEQSIEIIRRRVDEMGTREVNPTRQGANRIVVAAPGENDPEKLKNVIGKTAKLSFHEVDQNADLQQAAQGRVPPGDMVLPGDEYAPFYVIKRRSVVTGEQLLRANAELDQQTGKWAVSFRFNSQGARKFGDFTKRHIGKPFAIVLDNKVITAPNIISAITSGDGQITGNFTAESANELALLLRAGALPAPLKVEEQRTVTAELGADSIRAGTLSGIVGLIGVVIFMIGMYGWLFGGISILALIVNGLLIIAAMSLTQATLTLPGIAGLILTLAVAVDANVLIYERMRDELRAGRTLISAMEAGFSRAMGTILDANITHLLSAAIMFVFGSGPVRGFAWTLSIGVLTTVFSAVLVTQVLLGWWYRATRPKTLPIA